MSDLISRQAALDALDIPDYENGEAYSQYVNDKRAIELVPSAQPEIVRCKDCEHWDTTWQNDFAPNYHYCPLVDRTRRGDFYCADAERRGEQDE